MIKTTCLQFLHLNRYRRQLMAFLICSTLSSCVWSTATAQEYFSLPLAGLKLSSGYGYRIHPLSGKLDFHKGVDLQARNEVVYSILDGEVIQIAFHPILGNYVKLSHQGLVSIYGHLSWVLVRKGDWVLYGQPIGISGATGKVTGPHLHFSVCYKGFYLDPLEFLMRLSNPKRKNETKK